MKLKLLFLFFLSCIIDGLHSVNICASRNQEADLSINDFKNGMFIDINPNEIEDGVEVVPPDAECELVLPILDNPDGIIQLSFGKESRKNMKNCLYVKHEKVGDISGKSLDCTITNTSRKILYFQGKNNIDVLARDNGGKAGLRSRLDVDTRLYIKSVPTTPVPAVIQHVVGRVKIRCDYTNGFLLPSLFFGDFNNVVDLTANLTGRTYNKDISGDDEDHLKSVAGKYHCNWWEESAYNGPNKLGSIKDLSSSIFDVNVYAEKILCEVAGKTGDDLEYKVVKNKTIESLPISCMLSWSGSNDAVSLDWEKGSILGIVDRDNGDFKKTAMFNFEGILMDSLIFTCRASNASLFDGQITPNSCSVKLIAVDSLVDPEDRTEPTGLGAGWIIVIIIFIVGIAFIIAVLCARDNCIMNKLKALPCCTGCIQKLEDMKLISRWGTYKPDHSGSMTTVHTSTSQNDVNKNNTSGDFDDVVVKTPNDPPNALWSNSDNVSMDTDITIDEGLFDKNGVKIGRKSKAESQI